MGGRAGVTDEHQDKGVTSVPPWSLGHGQGEAQLSAVALFTHSKRGILQSDALAAIL